MSDLLVAVIAMFGAGVAAFVSPCVAPLVPGYLAVLGDAGADSPPGRMPGAVARVAAFGLAVAMTFALLGSVVSAAGNVFLAGRAAHVVAGVVLIVLAAWPWLARHGRLRLPAWAPGHGRPSTWRAAALGVACGVAWTPCVGSLLGAALTAAGGSGSTVRAGLLLFVFGLGVSTPLLALVLFPRPAVPRPARMVGRWIAAATPVLLVAIGVVLVAGWYDRLVAVL